MIRSFYRQRDAAHQDPEKYEKEAQSMKKVKFGTAAKVILLTIITFGLYGAYWAMNQSMEEEYIEDEEVKNDADSVKRAATSALLMRHDLH